MNCRPFIWMLLALVPVWAVAQDLNEPAEILRIMENSSVKYEIAMGDERVAVPVESGPENTVFTYSAQVDGEWTIATYDFDSTTARLYNAAEEDYQLGDYADARSKYIRIHELRPDIGVVATFIGQTYAQEGNPTAAEQWYQEAIDANFHDYMAHWLLAENLYARKQYAIAAAEIAVAWVLNRNARDIRIAVAKIFLADKRKWIDFEFVPNYRIQKTGDQVLVRFSEEWMMYALCKALWEYEPGYHRELGGGRNAFDMTQEKECLLNLAIGYDRMQKGKSTKHQEIETLVRAIQAKRSNEFIFMEQWLRLEPLIAYTQPKEAILALANYVLDIRAPRK